MLNPQVIDDRIKRARHKTLLAAVNLDGGQGQHYETGFLNRLFELYYKAETSEPDQARTKERRHRIIGGYIAHNTGKFGPALITSKAVALKPMLAELCWFLRGETNVRSLQEDGCHIWDEWADADGDLGLIYGFQWRGLLTDQVKVTLQRLMDQPHDSGNIVSAWNVADLGKMALRPCHTMWQVCVQDGKLDLLLYQRSADWFLGVPFNAASYTILQLILAKMVGLEPGMFHHYFGDTHLYENHVEPTRTWLDRIGTRGVHVNQGLHVDLDVKPLPKGVEVERSVLRGIRPEHIRIHGYAADPAIPAPVAV